MPFSSTSNQNHIYRRQTSNYLAQPEIAPGDIEMDQLGGYMPPDDFNGNEMNQ